MWKFHRLANTQRSIGGVDASEIGSGSVGGKQGGAQIFRSRAPGMGVSLQGFRRASKYLQLQCVPRCQAARRRIRNCPLFVLFFASSRPKPSAYNNTCLPACLPAYTTSNNAREGALLISSGRPYSPCRRSCRVVPTFLDDMDPTDKPGKQARLCPRPTAHGSLPAHLAISDARGCVVLLGNRG